MAKVLSFVSTDTPISGVTTNPIEIEKVNFGADFVEKISSKNEIVITNTTAPVGLAETFRFAIQPIEDIYRGSDIESSLRSNAKRGVSILVQHTYVMRETDSTDATYERLVPVTAHTVLKFPNSESLTAVIAEKSFRRHLAGWYLTGAHGTERISQLIRGVLLPSDVK